MDSGPETAVKSADDLPPPRQRKGLRPVSPPFSNVSMHRFNYYIALGAALLFALYAYRIIQYKAEAGSWWNLALGKRPAMQNMQNAQSNWAAAKGGNGGASGGNAEGSAKDFGDSEVENKINELAAALGLPSKDLASAIAGAVREYVPPASLSSIAAHQTGEAVQYIIDPSGAFAADQPQATAARVGGAVINAFEAAVGLDEPPTDVVS